MKRLKEFFIEACYFGENVKVKVCYHKDYISYGAKGNPDFLVTLKNWHRDKKYKELIKAKNEAKSYIYDILKRLKKAYTICVVPRKYIDKDEKQSFFRKAVEEVVNGLRREGSPIIFDDIFDDIFDIEDELLFTQDVILINDIYTKNTDIIENCVCNLLRREASSVGVYCIAKTKEPNCYKSDECCEDPYEYKNFKIGDEFDQAMLDKLDYSGDCYLDYYYYDDERKDIMWFRDYTANGRLQRYIDYLKGFSELLYELTAYELTAENEEYRVLLKRYIEKLKQSLKNLEEEDTNAVDEEHIELLRQDIKQTKRKIKQLERFFEMIDTYVKNNSPKEKKVSWEEYIENFIATEAEKYKNNKPTREDDDSDLPF
ncbi:hypothetical protein [Campylobacter cuniculorum]|uniref:Uncharacterized protein n=2 Tax=Campylobacter cuniculorum TaxID=374106 RepID=A0A1W6BYV3_9BACT|nr:hypothetical protein [Campylobacter cuniculorum]ARJ57264.1 hypothetical protein CCUN_1689 [Campylobacter cuniculorum DSM 23162 = LMG 24588]QOR04700.1 hypothetical protein A0071_01770 [Campylobacter cuniculorum]